MTTRATIDDVAELAEVSRAAVSKVLRDAHGVSPQMRERVQRAVEQLGYRPRLAARAMRGSTHTMGVVVNHLANQFLSEVLEGAVSAEHGTDFQFIVVPTDPQRSDGRAAIEALYDRQVDGIIAVAPLVSADWLEDFARRVPMVVIGRHDRSDTYDTVTGDDATGATLAVRHLIDLGHREIAHLTHLDAHVLSAVNTPHALRQEAYEATMHEAGLGESISIVVGRFEEGPAYEAMSRYLTDGHRPTAIFAGNDDAAFGAMRAIRECGIAPSELGVVGYDNSRLAAHPYMELSSVDQQGLEMGRLAFEALRSRIGGRTTAEHHVLAVHLHERASSLGSRQAASRDGGIA